MKSKFYNELKKKLIIRKIPLVIVLSALLCFTYHQIYKQALHCLSMESSLSSPKRESSNSEIHSQDSFLKFWWEVPILAAMQPDFLNAENILTLVYRS